MYYVCGHTRAHARVGCEGCTADMKRRNESSTGLAPLRAVDRLAQLRQHFPHLVQFHVVPVPQHRQALGDLVSQGERHRLRGPGDPRAAFLALDFEGAAAPDLPFTCASQRLVKP